jgi:FAD/FMN-containing dehydrogenase/Fe-S oxidoreductase
MSTDERNGVSPTPLDEAIDGDVDFGETARTLYSTDASIYQVRPAGVVAPKSTTDIRRVVDFARKRDVSITARGAGSSLTGNAVGEGIVLDCERHLDDVISVDPEAQTVTVQPGVVLDRLNDHLAQYDLYFPPDPSTSSTCTIGGMVANDAAGAHSVRHGTTRDHVRRVECVLADGTVAQFARYDGESLDRRCRRDDIVGDVHGTARDVVREHADEIDRCYPDVARNSSGYDLDGCAAADGSWVDLSTLLTGSEGTLGVITEVELDLTERPETRAAALVFYEGLLDAAAAVTDALTADPSAVELIDDAVLGYARDAWDIEAIPSSAGAALLIEVETTQGTQERDLEDAVTAATTDTTVGVDRALSRDARDRLWKVRKASNPLLNRRPGDEQSLSFIEDAAVPPESLPEYLNRVGAVLADHDLEASVFGHAGQGVLHIKPFLDLSSERDRERLRSVSERVHEIVLDVGGCLSGEHGDGMLRSQYLPEMYGETLYEAFIEVKRTFDPQDVFNPAKVVPSSDGRLASVDEQLRYEGYDPETVESALDFSDSAGFASLIEQCNGCSNCRTTEGGVMCPSYRGEETEITSTRGRANMLRAAIDGELGEDALTSDWFQEDVLDRCLACKACETECPTGVDLAKLKTEAKHRKHRDEGAPLRARLFGNVRTLNRLGSALAPVANRIAEFPPARIGMEKLLGIDRRRSLPAFHRESFLEWFGSHDPTPQAGTEGPVVLFPDCYTTYNHPAVGKAAVRVLEAIGFAVTVPDVECCGRPALSQGLVGKARGYAADNAATLGDYVDRDVPILGVEPSCVSALNEYDELSDERVPIPAMSVAEFLRQQLPRSDVEIAEPTDRRTVAFHSHCHSKAKGRDRAPVDILRTVGYDVDVVDATCCGMAGAFGYKVEQYDLSMAIGDDLETKLDRTDADVVATTGASCSQQLGDRDIDTDHPLELVAEVVA